MKIICISDTHLRHGIYVPEGDVLVHSGDATLGGSLKELGNFATWFHSLPHKHKIFVAGNHDWAFQEEPEAAQSIIRKANAIYLEDSGCDIDGVKFWGSPWQPWFLDWAFNLPRGPELKAHWDMIPEDTNVLITHSPPLGALDMVERGESVGCQDLRNAVDRIKPKYHIFGHIHESAGVYVGKDTTFVNASICDLSYAPVNPARVLEI